MAAQFTSQVRMLFPFKTAFFQTIAQADTVVLFF
jgi:hypothetical protein